MKDDDIFGQGGEELTGKIPVQYFVKGADPTGRGLAEAKQYLKTFLTNIRNSTLQQSQFRAPLTVGGEVTISHIFGVTQVEITLNPNKAIEAPFYGGILIHPCNVPTTTRELLAEVGFSGKTSKLSGRPAVPGTAEADQTDWLVVQITKDKPLGPTPIASGTVKIFRIKDPKHGPVCEISSSRRKYLVSTAGVGTSTDFTFPEFFLCGKKLVNVPALAPGPFTTAGVHTRLCTVNFSVKKFQDAANLVGVTIVAVGNRLFAVNAALPSPTWQLLDEKPYDLQYMNAYGDVAKLTRSPDGTQTLVCSGSNGAGVCSGFTVTVTTAGVVSGSLTLMGNGFIPSVPAVQRLTKSFQHTPAPAPVDRTTIQLLNHATTISPIDGLEYTTTLDVLIQNLYRYARGSSTSMSMLYTQKGTVPAQNTDLFAGGYLPTARPFELTVSWDISRSYQLLEWEISIKGFPWKAFGGSEGLYDGPGGDSFDLTTDGSPPDYAQPNTGLVLEPRTFPIFAPRMQFEITGSGTFTYSDDDFTGFTTIANNFHEVGVVGIGAPPPTYSFSSTKTPTLGSIGISPTSASAYLAYDLHTNRLAIRRALSRTATVSGEPLVNRPELFDMNQMIEGKTAMNALTDAVRGSLTQLDCGIRLVRRDLTVLAEWPDVFVDEVRPILARASASTQVGTCYTTMPYEVLALYTDVGNVPSAGTSRPPAASYDSFHGLFPDVEASKYAGVVSDVDLGTTLNTGYVDDAIAQTMNYNTTLEGSSAFVTPLSTFMSNFPTSRYARDGATEPDEIRVFPRPNGNPNTAVGKLATSAGTPDLPCFLLRDMRCGGFIAQVKLYARTEAVIGNEYGSTPLVDVLNEWFRLGSSSSPSFGLVGGAPYVGDIFINSVDLATVRLL